MAESRKKRNTEQKRKSLIDAAIKVYCQKGYYDASMDNIAEEAGASKRTLYNHFQNKENLFLQVITSYLMEQQQYKKSIYNPELPIKQQLSAFIDAQNYLVNTPTRRGLAKVLTTVFLREPQLAMKAKSMCEPGIKLFEQWLEIVKDKGEMRIEDPEKGSFLFYSLVEGAITWPALFGGPTEGPEFEVIRSEIIETFISRYTGNV